MKITKLGHCCLVIEITTPALGGSGTPFDKGDRIVRMMTDPGAYSSRQNEVRDIEYIFITHEHQDHFHLESLKIVLQNNPQAKIVSNKGVGKLLDAEHIPYTLLEHGEEKMFSGILVEGHGEKHATIYEEYGQVLNTGYLFANRFFYPGDAFYNLQKPVEILALPVSGGWVKISEALEYAKLLKPRFAFPVHDGTLKIFGVSHAVPGKFLPQFGIEFRVAVEGTELSF